MTSPTSPPTPRAPEPLHPFPVMLDLRGREVLVVGSDEDAVRRARRLARAGAIVRVLCRQCVHIEVEAGERVHIEERAPRPEDVDGKALVYVATSEDALAPPLFERARDRGQLLCTIDRPELSTFINPAVVELGAVALTISTGGASPALASRLRQDLEALLGTATFARFVEELRAHREALPRGERAREAPAKVEGFAVRGEIAYPPWFEAD